MARQSNSARFGVTRRSFATTAAAAGLLAGAAPFSILRAQSAPLKVGVLLPRSGAQASIGQDCQRGVEIAPAIFKQIGMPELAIMNADTETNVEVARSRAEKLINDGAQLLVGAFDSGQSTAIAQVAEQKGIPFVINIAAAPAITEQGYAYVFRNFPTAGMIVTDMLLLQKEVFAYVKATPKKMVLMHVNDTYGTAVLGGIKALIAGVEKAYPGRNVATNQVYTFEALLIVADAYRRAKSTDPSALAEALRASDITDNVTIGRVAFNAKGQNESLRCAAAQNRNGRLVVVAPRSAANGEPIWPIRPWDQKAT